MLFKRKRNLKLKQITIGGSGTGMSRRFIKPSVPPVPSKDSLILAQDVFRFTQNGIQDAGNTFVIGSAASGKTYDYVYPNLLQCNSNYIITDVYGELARKFLPLFQELGYQTQVLSFERAYDHLKEYIGDASDNVTFATYNPFSYLDTKEDIYYMAESLCPTCLSPVYKKFYISILTVVLDFFKNDASVKDRTLTGLFSFFYEWKCSHRVTFTPLERYVHETTDDWVKDNYKLFINAPEELHDSILITLVSEFTKYQDIYCDLKDSLDLKEFTKDKRVLFVELSVYETSYDQMQSLLIGQAIRSIHKSEEGHPVHFILEEYQNFHIHDIIPMMAVSKTHNILYSFICQNLSQLYTTVAREEISLLIANCKQICFLGGQDRETLNYLSKLSGGKLSAQELRNLPREKAVIIMKEGDTFLIADKYNPQNHPNYSYLK